MTAGRIWPNFREALEAHPLWQRRISWKNENPLDSRQYGRFGPDQIVYDALWYHPDDLLILKIRLPFLEGDEWKTPDILKMLLSAVQTDHDYLQSTGISAAYQDALTLEKEYLEKRILLTNQLQQDLNAKLSQKYMREKKSTPITCDYFGVPDLLLDCLWQNYAILGSEGMQGWSSIVERWNAINTLSESSKAKLIEVRSELKTAINRKLFLKEYANGLDACIKTADNCLNSRLDVVPRWNLFPLAIFTAVAFWLAAVFLYRK